MNPLVEAYETARRELVQAEVEAANARLRLSQASKHKTDISRRLLPHDGAVQVGDAALIRSGDCFFEVPFYSSGALPQGAAA